MNDEELKRIESRAQWVLDHMSDKADARDVMVLAAEVRRLRAALSRLADQCDAVIEATAGAMALAAVHGAPYEGPTLDVAAAREALR